MPWKASSVMEERLRFVVRVLDGEPMSELCREFGISRKTGYKIYDRYNLTDRVSRGLEHSRPSSCRQNRGRIILNPQEEDHACKPDC